MKKVLFIQPGTSLTGAPLQMLHLISWLKKNSDLEFVILLYGEGPLRKKFSCLGKTYFWDGYLPSKGYERYYPGRLLKRILNKLACIKKRSYQDFILKNLMEEDFDLVYANTSVSASLIVLLKEKLNVKVIAHIHELEISTREFAGLEVFKKAIPLVDKFIAVSRVVSSNLEKQFGINPEIIKQVYPFLIPRKFEQNDILQRKKYGIPPNAFLVVGSGTLDWRKGPDLFILVARKALLKKQNIFFLWVGGNTNDLAYHKLNYDLNHANLLENVKFVGTLDDPLSVFEESNVFLLTSREDPYPLVCLEAASVGKPIICFENSGGMPEFVENDCGFIIPYLDIDQMAIRIVELALNSEMNERMGENAKEKVKKHDIKLGCNEIKKIIEQTLV